MSRISLDNEFNIRELSHLRKCGYPECDNTPLTVDNIKSLKIGSACYIATLQSTFKLVMFTGYFEKVDEFRFCCDQGAYWYKAKNAGKTYNVFKANVKED